jgi:predicted nucleic acid-binding protein
MSAESRAFVDTNVLVYAHDPSADAKQTAAISLIGDLWESAGDASASRSCRSCS